MTTLAERLQQGLARRNKRPADLARACHVKSSSVSEWLSGNTKALKSESARLAAQFLGCRREWLETGIGNPSWTDEQHPPAGLSPYPVAHNLSAMEPQSHPYANKRVPIIGRLAKGENDMFTLHAEPDGRPIGTVPIRGAADGTHALQVFGDDLYPAIRHGMCLVISANAACAPGELALIETHDGMHLVCELVAEHPDAVTWTPATGGPRRTMPREQIARMHAIVCLVPGSQVERPAPQPA